jgi:hypothetical protein
MSASRSFLHPWQPFGRIWRVPSLAAWALVIALAQGGGRVLFDRVPVVPYAVPLEPAAGLHLLWLLAFGPAGWLGCLVGQGAGDWVAGLPIPLIVFRALGLAVGGIWVVQMARRWGPDFSRHPAGRPGPLAVLALGAPLALSQAAWSATGLEWAGWYPFAYTFGLFAVQSLGWLILLAVPLTPGGVTGLLSAFPHWQAVAEAAGGTGRPEWRWRAGLFLGGLVLAVAAALLISWYKYGLAFLHPTVIGVHGGRPVPAAATWLLSLQVLSLWIPDRHVPQEPSSSPLAPQEPRPVLFRRPLDGF